ncbi:MAG: GNAT family N-acetyltransferase [Frankiaceae bacterium]|nr:GNAT family N-acetyltransferase [Frankiaceae bacterium]MBV9368293.1 GNAT family N-acetyltransferase [Frankiales bacterium]
MPRSPVTTRLATLHDVPVLAALWHELRQLGGRAERAMNPVAIPDIAARLAQAIAADDCRVVLACADGEPAGMAIYRPIQPDPLSDSEVLQMTHVIVSPGKRRRGVGRALVAAGADIADALQVEHVGVGVYPSLRDASRFYARLGFAPVLVQRIAPIGVLRRRLGADNSLARVEDLVRRRNRVRRPLPAPRAGRRTAEPAPRAGRRTPEPVGPAPTGTAGPDA